MSAYLFVNLGMYGSSSICWELVTPQLLLYLGNEIRVVTMLRYKGQQGQVSLRQALTAATTGTYDYMQRCHAKMRSELPNITVRFTAGILSSAFIRLDLSVEGDKNTQKKTTHDGAVINTN